MSSKVFLLVQNEYIHKQIIKVTLSKSVYELQVFFFIGERHAENKRKSI